jgi:Holliday junction DNA helicase RuvA
MYAYIKGELAEKANGFVVIENNEIGYKIFMANSAIGRLGELHSRVKVYTYYQVSEDNICLYGFNTKEELAMFELLITVSGIGPKSAIGMLANMEPSSFALAVINEDIKKITSLPGIGTKTAQRLVLELKDKLKKENSITQNEEVKAVVKQEEISSDAVNALQILGYGRKEIENTLKKFDCAKLSTEDIIRTALKYLA